MSCADGSKGSMFVLSFVSFSSIYLSLGVGKMFVEGGELLAVNGRCVRTSGDIGWSGDVVELPALSFLSLVNKPLTSFRSTPMVLARRNVARWDGYPRGDAIMNAYSSLLDSNVVRNGGAREQFLACCIWNWVAVALETAVMASVATVPHTMEHPGDWHRRQSRSGLFLRISLEILSVLGRGVQPLVGGVP